MKKLIILTLVVLSIVGFSSAQERNGLVVADTQVAIDFLYENGLTMFSTENDFMASQSLRRDEAAAFFARFSRDVLGNTPDISKTECGSFSDLSRGHSDLQGEMIASCQLGLFKGSQGRFMPTASFTNAEALTVLVRLIDGFKDETGSHWADNYLLRAKQLGLTNGLAADYRAELDIAISRGDVARLIEAGNQKLNLFFDPNQPNTIQTIKGTLGFPSDFIPNMSVCAVNIATQQETCVNNNNDTYSINVEPGEYRIYAETENYGSKDSKAYYTECDTYENSYIAECNSNAGDSTISWNNADFICYENQICKSAFTPLTINIQEGEVITLKKIEQGRYIPCSHDLNTCNDINFDVREDYI